MKLNPMPVGARVTIRPSSKFYGRHRDLNPAGEEGVVERYDGEVELGYTVRWLHSDRTNNYRRTDLKYWKKKIPEKEMDEDGINKAVDRAIEECKAHDQSVTARYAFVYRSGRIVVENNTACHYSAMYKPPAEKRRISTIVTMIAGHEEQGRLTEEENLAYYDWLLNRSPWAQAFTTKDAVEAYKKIRYVRMNLAAPANMVQGALVATRQAWEHKHVLKTFKQLVDKGLPENTAFLLSCMFRRSGNSSLIPSLQGSGHFPICIDCMRKSDCLSFINNTPSTLEKPYNEGGESKGAHDMFIHRDAERAQDEVSMLRYARAVAERAGAAKSKLATNPFTNAKMGSTREVKIDDLVNYVLTQGIFV